MTKRDEDHLDEDEQFLRPFTLTGGRTRSAGRLVAVEAIVAQVSGPGPGAPHGVVEADIHRLAAEQISSAELAASLDLPVGVVRVLVGDLVAGGHLRLGATPTDGSVQLVRRLIDGVRAL